MCQICRTGQSILEVAYSLAGPREMAQMYAEVKEIGRTKGKDLDLGENDVPAFIFAAISHALALHCVQQRVADPEVIIAGIRVNWNKLVVMKALGITEHTIQNHKDIRDYDS